MTAPEGELLTEVEQAIRARFDRDEASKHPTPSTAQPAKQSARVSQLVLPKDTRPKMPATKEKYLVRENPHLVEWERVTREFLRELSPEHGHRVSAVMVYEWATGIKVAELVEGGGSANRELRFINTILREYFGKGYITYIMGRKVKNAYKVKPGHYVRRRRPHTLALYAEWLEGTLYP